MVEQADPEPRRRRRSREATFPRAVPDIAPAVERVVEQRYAGALAEVARLRADHPEETPEQLANRLIRSYAKDMAIGGAVAGGAAAAPVAGMAVAAASAGVESAYSVGRLGEMIMAIGLLYGHSPTSVDERRNAVLAVMGMADGAAVGVSGLAARAGSRGGARLLRRLPTSSAGVAAGSGKSRAALAKVAGGRGPWSVASLVPYGIGAGVGAAGNALLARAVGRAAKEYYGSTSRWPAHHPDDDAEPVDSEIVDDGGPGPTVRRTDWSRPAEEIIDAEVVDAEIVASEVVDPPAAH